MVLGYNTLEDPTELMVILFKNKLEFPRGKLFGFRFPAVCLAVSSTSLFGFGDAPFVFRELAGLCYVVCQRQENGRCSPIVQLLMFKKPDNIKDPPPDTTKVAPSRPLTWTRAFGKWNISASAGVCRQADSKSSAKLFGLLTHSTNWNTGLKIVKNRAKQILKKVVTVPRDCAEKRTKKQRIGHKKWFLILTKYFDPVHLPKKNIMTPIWSKIVPKMATKLAKMVQKPNRRA